jgi:hypothetical protein
VTFAVVDDGNDAVASYKWEWACRSPGCSGGYSDYGLTDPMIDVTFWNPGTYYLRLTVTYSTVNCVTPPPTVIVHSQVVLPPDGCRLLPGYNASTTVGEGVWWQFQITGGGNDPGGLNDLFVTSGQPQERIYNNDPTTG